MRRLTLLFWTLALVGAVGCPTTQDPEGDANTAVTRIGIYDSRAIAVAFIGSEVYTAAEGEALAEKTAEFENAEAARDHEKLAELKAREETQRTLRQAQGFSTAPVDDILEYIAAQLPGIKKEANVELVVSKWDDETLSAYTSAERVDVTMRLVEAFRPNEKQRQSAIEIQEVKPVPLRRIRTH